MKDTAEITKTEFEFGDFRKFKIKSGKIDKQMRYKGEIIRLCISANCCLS